MAITRFGFESGANLDAATPGNTGAATILATGGSLAISTVWAKAGTRSLKGVATATSGGVYAQYTVTTATALYAEMYVYLTAGVAAEAGFLFLGSGATRNISVGANATLNLRVRDGAGGGGGAAYTSVAAVPLSTPVKVAFFATQHASAGTFRLAWATAPFTAWDSDSGLITGKNTGAAPYDSIRIGPKITVGTTPWDALHIDEFGWEAGGSGFPGGSPVFAADPAQSSHVFLDLSGTTFATGPVVFSAAPATGVVATAGGLFLPVPAVGSTTYTVTATDTGNASSSTTTVSIAAGSAATGDMVETVVWSGAAWT